MILFRADGNEKIGSGHIMRCLSIADAFSNCNEECVFVISEKNFEFVINNRGYRTIILNTNYLDLESELDVIKVIINQNIPRLLFVDSYYVTYNYLNFIKSLCRTVYIDDLLSFAYPTDYLINYNIYSSEEEYINLYENSTQQIPVLLLGVKYVPLRSEFRNPDCFRIKKHCSDIFVSTGGADPIHLALDVIKYICSQKETLYIYHFVIGTMNKDIDEIVRISENRNDIVLHTNVNDMKSLMQKCDIAVSAAGSTLYELCACGVPTITYVLADNQVLGASKFHECGAMVSLGDIRESIGSKLIIDKIKELDSLYEIRKEMINKMKLLIDGGGAERIIKTLDNIQN